MTNRALYDQFIGTMGRANTHARASSRIRMAASAMLLNDPALYDRFVTVVTSADSLVIALNDKNGTIGKLLRDDTLYTHFVNMAVAGDSLMKLLSSGQGLAGRLLNDPTLYDQLEQADDGPRRHSRGRSQGSAQVFQGRGLRDSLQIARQEYPDANRDLGARDTFPGKRAIRFLSSGRERIALDQSALSRITRTGPTE